MIKPNNCVCDDDSWNPYEMPPEICSIPPSEIDVSECYHCLHDKGCHKELNEYEQ